MSDRTPPEIGTNALAAERARLGRFFQAINKHRKALDLAIEEGFGGKLDPGEWRSAFESAGEMQGGVLAPVQAESPGRDAGSRLGSSRPRETLEWRTPAEKMQALLR